MGQSIQQRHESHQPIQYQESAAVGDTHDVNFRTMGPTKTVPSGDLQQSYNTCQQSSAMENLACRGSPHKSTPPKDAVLLVPKSTSTPPLRLVAGAESLSDPAWLSSAILKFPGNFFLMKVQAACKAT